MKRTMLALIAFVVACVSPGLATSGFDGTWTATVPGPAGQGGLPVTFVFSTENGKSGGSVSTADRTFALVDVKIDGQTIAFAVEGEEQNKYTGTLSGDQIKMQVKYPSHENGTRTWTFVAKRAAATPEVSSVDGDWSGDVPRGGGRVITATFTLHADGGVARPFPSASAVRRGNTAVTSERTRSE